MWVKLFQLKVYVPKIYSNRTSNVYIDYVCQQGVNPRNKNLEYNINSIPPRIRFFKKKRQWHFRLFCLLLSILRIDQVFFVIFDSIFMRLRQFFETSRIHDFCDTQIYNLLVYIMLIGGLLNLIFQGLINLIVNILPSLERLHVLSSTSNTLFFTFKVLKFICDFYLSGNSLFIALLNFALTDFFSKVKYLTFM